MSVPNGGQVTPELGILFEVILSGGRDRAMYVVKKDGKALPRNNGGLFGILIEAVQEGRAVVVGEADVVITRFGVYATKRDITYVIQDVITLQVRGDNPLYSHQI